ncbi:ricin-type beta-trefoil lectin domain protein [Luteibacter jiangsuensis]|uniref:Ricin-type beta-trefoil lectin domain protein n=1 Tax=Luteibacter jiangsuensis TaxID=637577 RepID=A0ABX0Q015_9GAMM|nr:ricin-type beta-trefoil lectin domain protein [Luteibacter jiangsuensis]NID03757.1 ricin-type beta-trefoil lectin domain protein [Luteibacter jiangsuensis]
MKAPTLVLNALTIALGFGLAHAVSAEALPPLLSPTAISPDPLADVLVVFGKGDSPAVSPDDTGTTIVPAATLGSDAIAALAAARSGRVLVSLSSRDLPLSSGDAVSLSRLYEGGIPVLLHMDDDSDEELARVSKLFGIAPATTGDVVVVRGADGTPQIYAAEGDATSLGDLLVAAAAKAPTPSATARRRIDPVGGGAAMPLAPTRRFSVNFVDDMGEVSGANIIEVVRSRTNSSDAKVVNIVSRVTVRTSENGVVDGGRTGKNLWGTYLPIEYRLSQKLTADGVQPRYLSHFPETDERTDYTRNETKTRGFSIGGSTGTELSASGKPDDVLAAKLPFNVALGYEYSQQSSLSSTFKDYAILAVPKAPDSVEWKALLNESLKGVLVKRGTASTPELSEEKMTPTMRAITLNTLSEWVLPGAYEGLATVTVSAGYELERTEWWWQRTQVERARTWATRDVPASFVVDMSDPHLTSEITVLIRSAVGTGACLQDDGDVVLAACNVMDRKQMWGLDASNRYVNRGTGRCLTADTTSRGVVTRPCGLTFEQQWEWRADRLHSFIDHAKYRLYVEGGRVHYYAAEGRFQDYPVNPYGSPLEPWTNYPSAPRPGIDQQPAPAGNRPIAIPDTWGTTFRPVDAEQRWHLEVIRQGL